MASAAAAEADASVEQQIDVKTEEAPKKTKEPKYTKLTQQELGACKPVLEPKWVMLIFVLVALVLIPIGAVCLAFGLKPVSLSYRYDQVCFPPAQLSSLNSNVDRQSYIWANAADDAALSCNVTLTVTKDMAAPVYVYYELNGFYQNHRRYVKSRSDLQLVNKSGSTGVCDPEEFYAGNTAEVINPCGLTAWSNFNDTYDMALSRSGAAPTVLNISSQGIAFQSDVKYRYANYLPAFFNPVINASRGGANITTTVKEDERFITWMRLAALPKFSKLWGIIDTDLQEGDTLSVVIFNRYNTFSFNGQKTLVLSTTTWLGSHNPFLGIAYLVTGILSLLLGLIYLVLHIARPRKFGDISQLSINRVGHH